MSWIALGWASQQRLARCSDKMVLIALADRHNEEMNASWPSINWLTEFCCLDRKTVIAALDRLERDGFIKDTGRRTGKTKQVKIYSVAIENGAEKGIPKTEPLEGNDTTFSGKQSQKRNTEPFREPVTVSTKQGARDRAANRPDGVSEETWGDFRRQRKKIFTETALKLFVGEAVKAGWTLEDAFAYATMRGWEGFNAEWVERRAANDGAPAKAMTPAEQAAFYRKIGRDEDADEIERQQRRRGSTGPPQAIGDVVRGIAGAGR